MQQHRDRLSLRHLDTVAIEADLAEHAVRVVAADEPAIGVLSTLGDVPHGHTMTTRRRRWAWDLVTDECTRRSSTEQRITGGQLSSSEDRRDHAAVKLRLSDQDIGRCGVFLGEAHCLLGVDRGVLDHRIPHRSQARLRKEGRR